MNHNLKTSLRYLLRQKKFVLFSAVGLTIAFLTVFIFSAWLFNELSFDRFHSKANRIYRFTVETSDPKSGYSAHFARCWHSWRKNIPDYFSSVECMTELRPLRKTTVRIGEDKFYNDQLNNI